MLKSQITTVEMLTEGNAKVLAEFTKAIQAIKKTIIATNEKFEKDG